MHSLTARSRRNFGAGGCTLLAVTRWRHDFLVQAGKVTEDPMWKFQMTDAVRRLPNHSYGVLFPGSIYHSDLNDLGDAHRK